MKPFQLLTQHDNLPIHPIYGVNNIKHRLIFHPYTGYNHPPPAFENDHIKKELQKPLQLFNTPLWTSLGLNQGPPDSESVALTN